MWVLIEGIFLHPREMLAQALQHVRMQMGKLESECNQQRLAHTGAMDTLRQEHMRRNVAASALLEQHRSETAARLAEVSQNEERAVATALKEHTQQNRAQYDNALRAYTQLETDAAARLSAVEQTHARRYDGLKRALAQAEATQQRQLQALQSQRKEMVATEQASKRGRFELQQAVANAAADRKMTKEMEASLAQNVQEVVEMRRHYQTEYEHIRTSTAAKIEAKIAATHETERLNLQNQIQKQSLDYQHTMQQEMSSLREKYSNQRRQSQHQLRTKLTAMRRDVDNFDGVMRALQNHFGADGNTDKTSVRPWQLLADIAQKITQVEQRTAHCQRQVQTLTQRWTAARSRSENVKAQCHRLQLEHNVIGRQHTEATEALNTLTVEHADAGQRLKTAQQELAQCQKQSASTLQLKERHWEREMQALSYRTQDQQREVEALQASCRATQTTCDTTQSSLRKAEHELEIARTQLDIERSRLSERHWHREKAVNALKVRV